MTLTAGSRKVALGGSTDIGRKVDLDLSRAWLVDPVGGREGAADVIVRDGILQAVTWLDGRDANGVDDRGVVVAPGFTDLHAHFREPGNAAAETIATGCNAATSSRSMSASKHPG